MEKSQKITNFTDLHSWQEAHKLYVLLYSITKKFPKEELFGLTNQIRRASLSVSSNISEGFGRSSVADRTHFYIMARGSLYEVQNQLIAARDILILEVEDFEKIYNQSVTAQKLLLGLIKATKLKEQK